MIKTKNETVFKGSHKLCSFYIAAVFLVGQFGDVESIDSLKDLFTSPDVKTFDDVTYSVMALKTIAEKHPSKRNQINSFIKETLQKTTFRLPMTMQGNNTGLQKTRIERGELFERLLAIC